MSSDLVFYDDSGKPVFSEEYLEIEKNFVDVEPVTIFGDGVIPSGPQELNPIKDLA